MSAARLVPVRYPRSCALAAACLLLSGCVTKQLEPDFATFSTAYADNMNWQMLLNLARLDQGHPAYFMAIGEIRLGRTQSVGLSGSGTNSHTVAAAVSKTVTNVLSSTITPSTSATANPSFVFIPINSEEATKQLLAPVPLGVFNTLYQQGWPVDQLMRVMVERIEVDFGEEEGTRSAEERKPIVLMNSPTRAGLEDDGESFARFLRTCEVVRALQKAGRLSLTIEDNPEWKKYQAANPETFRTPKSGDDGRVKKPTDANPSTEKTDAAPPPVIYQFKATGDLHAFLDRFRNDPVVSYNAENEVDHLEVVFKSSNLLVGSRNDPKAVGKGPRAVLVLRSFSSVLEAVAQEQRAVDALRQQGLSAWSRIPLNQRQPVLRTDWSLPGPTGTASPKDLLRPVALLKFNGNVYQITDPVGGNPLDLHSRWNRDVFRLLIDLSYQVTVDITKFQRQVLELSQ